ncbi:o-succinylbenzoate synthase [Echinicola vietnamensis]|uniref:o-succinylbenzoate synthase n=1 Tax=Echinicola vietnamensis (strain DSM 17526 / LMG 23754 / KMM 6221) TaxID=926556 RepID=L0G161_ECHVK|nr:o-succinylbenzoate synthase [Echinicola vietnamensis]AGA79949.1 o-succinylbenzoic acid synthetase [Echinicola vietnamensis DSM 17526]
MNHQQPNPLKVNASWHKYTLDFKFDAGTSRGVLKTKDSYFIKIWSQDDPETVGWGEAGPLPKLSPEEGKDLPSLLDTLVKNVSEKEIHRSEECILAFCEEMVATDCPSVRFALETALLDLHHGGRKLIMDNDFFSGQAKIPINGLIWMGDAAFMHQQIEDKLAQGFTCIKMKIGAINFEEECRLLAGIRERFSADEITLRVDANGAFSPAEAMDKLRRLAAFDLHSIEQPIKAGQYLEMQRLCASSPLPIALDEELIGVTELQEKAALLDTIKPPFIILKPTLVGGIKATREWIRLAEARQIGWWMTSALESNIGLNAIAQLTASYPTDLPQGLGTGQLYHNNIASPLEIQKGQLVYQPGRQWGD